MKQRTREIKNIGTVLTNEIELSDTCLGLYIPIETESANIKAEREKFESWVVRDAKKLNPEVDFDKCTLNTETDLHINTGYRQEDGRYTLDFSVGFVSWFEDTEGNEKYWDISDNFEIELSEEDRNYIKKVMAHKIVDALI